MNDDLVLEILARLPTKSLRRFQSVSKSWCNLISHVFSHREVLLPMSGFLAYVDDWKLAYASIDLDRAKDCRFFESRLRSLPMRDTIGVIHSCNGLLLFRDLRVPFYSLYYIWNPATDEFAALPESPRQVSDFMTSCFLACDPRDGPHYKVVKLSHYYGEKVHLYSSVSGSWSEHNGTQLMRSISCGSIPAFYKGTLQMLTNDNHLLQFDIEEATFSLITLPQRCHDNGRPTACILESGGHLYYVVHVIPMLQLHIYMFDEGNSENWLLMESVDILFPVRPLIFRPIAWQPESEVVFLAVEDKFLSYHISSGKLEQFYEFSNGEWTMIFPITHCLESMIQPGVKYINLLDFKNSL